jgi:hypothetical protein
MWIWRDPGCSVGNGHEIGYEDASILEAMLA